MAAFYPTVIYRFPDEGAIQRSLLNHPCFTGGWPKQEIINSIVAIAAKHFENQLIMKERMPVEVGLVIDNIKQRDVERIIPAQYFELLPAVLQSSLIKCANDFVDERSLRRLEQQQ